MKHKTSSVFGKPFLEEILSGSTISGLTSDCIVVLLFELALYTKKNILVYMENSEFAIDFFNKGYEYNERFFSFLPEAKSENSVPGFESEIARYRKESLLKSSSGVGVVCFGTAVSFG